MPIIKVTDLAYGRLRSPDLDKQEEFLTAFGMVRADRTKTALYMRGTDAPHHIHVTELGEPKYVGIARSPKIKIERPKVNHGEDKTQRRNTLYYKNVERGPSHVKRFGHFVIHTPQFDKTLGWYREMFGFICSDEVYDGAKTNIGGSFNRLDRGDDFVDHHAFFCIRSDKAGLNHLSFEAADIDDIMIGHEHLVAKGYEHFWGLGRHSLGSQVYDYWGDPWGRVHEHWADTDVLNASVPPNLVSREELAGPWGGPPSPRFMGHASP